MEKLLGEKLYLMICKSVEITEITEIRIRLDKPLIVKINNKNIVINNLSSNQPYVINEKDIDYIIGVASEHSVYSIDNQLIHGYITYQGIRIGVLGEAVYINNSLKTIKNINSLVIRIPHEIKGAADKIIDLVIKNGQVYNTLILSKPAIGKTTILRDLARQISNKGFDTLIVDERNEIAGVNKDKNFDVGVCSDIYTNIIKNDAYELGIRACNPDVIVVDEIYGENELNNLYNINNLGVSIIGTMHFNNSLPIKQHKYYNLISSIFNFIVMLDNDKVGKIDKIFRVSDA